MSRAAKSLFAGRVFRHSLGPFADGMLGEFARQQQADSSLDLSAGDPGCASAQEILDQKPVNCSLLHSKRLFSEPHSIPDVSI